MSAQIAAILGLVVMFVIGTALPINMGALAFVVAFVIGRVFANLSVNEVLGGFPGDLFVTLVGITYLFAIAHNNGTIDWLVHKVVRAVRGRIAAIPWVMFATAAVLTAFGALGPATVGILAPVALRFARRYNISPLLMGLMVIHGAQAGGFSPISVYGGITNQVVERAGLPDSAMGVFLASLLFNFAIAIGIFFFFGGHRTLQRRNGSDAEAVLADGQEEGEREPALSWQGLLTLIGLCALAVGALVFDLNVGFAAITVAVVLALLSPNAQKKAIDQVSWSTVLLITGVITYIGVLQKAGTIDFVGNGVSGIGIPLLAALLLCYIGGVVSAFASSVGVLGATIPLAVPFLLQGGIAPIGVVAAIAVSTTIVDVCPFSTNGALVVANVQGVDKDVFYRKLLIYSAVVTVAGPPLAWLTMVVPGWL